MRIFTINPTLQVVCRWEKTRNGFRHTATLVSNGYGYDKEKVKINYLNRTWERFEFESVIQKLIDKNGLLTESEKIQAKEMLKTIN